MKFFFLLPFFLFFNAEAADRSKDRTWLGILSKKNLGNEYSLWSEFQLRYDNNNTTMQQTMIRFGPLLKLDQRNEIGLLAAFIQTGSIDEYRPTFQHIYLFDQKPFSGFTYRSRLEGRFLENNPDFSLRYRGLLRFQTPIKNQYSFVAWEEPFINFTKDEWTEERFFDRNRFFIGSRISFNDVHLEVGYMNQFVPRQKTSVYEHILTAYLFY